jgi:hypothetical protein
MILGLAACGDEAPKPPATPAPQAPIAKPAPPPTPAPEAKAPEAPKPDPNKELAAKVKRALEGEAKIHAQGIDVTASDGKITLWGTAATNAERARATRTASAVEGVTSVENKLAVVKGS